MLREKNSFWEQQEPATQNPEPYPWFLTSQHQDFQGADFQAPFYSWSLAVFLILGPVVHPFLFLYPFKKFSWFLCLLSLACGFLLFVGLCVKVEFLLSQLPLRQDNRCYISLTVERWNNHGWKYWCNFWTTSLMWGYKRAERVERKQFVRSFLCRDSNLLALGL